MRARWEAFKDWWMGEKCPIHGERPSRFWECLACDIERWSAERDEEERQKREARIEEIAEGVRRAKCR
jgi:hypothetical protein